MEKNECNVKISEKALLTIIEANALGRIGLNKLRNLTNDPRCPFVFYVGKRKMIKKAFELFLDKEIEYRTSEQSRTIYGHLSLDMVE